MAIEKDLSVRPYFDDFDEEKNFHRILHKPDVAVQVRELNQVQAILQNQIERMGNNLFKRGTIIDGCNFVFYDNYPYVKIDDVQLDGGISVPGNYVGLFAKNETGLKARIVDSKDGFETTNPDLKTIYVQYINSGDSNEETEFSSGQILTVYDSNSSIYSVDIDTAGSGYSNSDVLVFTPVLLVNVSSGSISVGDEIYDPATNAHGIVTEVDDETERSPNVVLTGTINVSSTSVNVSGDGTSFTSDFSDGDYVTIYSNTTHYVHKKVNVVANDTFMNLSSNASVTVSNASYANSTDSRIYVTYRPLSNALSVESSSSDSWTFSEGNTVYGETDSDILTIVEIVGENAAAGITTDSSGRVQSVEVTNRGNGYERLPYVSAKSSTGSGASFTALNFLAQVTVSDLASPVGTGYAFGVGEGIIYQKGYFIRVDPQVIVVDKYSNRPDGVTVGFVTDEEIVDANIDTSLFDNVSGFSNENAPGADRLKLSPRLKVVDSDSDDNDSEFFNLVEWSDGYPYKQNSRTAYNVINDQIASEIDDIHGSFVVDRFLVTTTTPANSSLSANTVSVVVDPGTAYVRGYKVQTLNNYVIDSPKALDTKVEENAKVSLNYENYVRVDDVGGIFEFDRGNEVSLYDTARNFQSNSSAYGVGNTTPVGASIGKARIRNFVYEQGVPGTPSCVYRVYLFDIRMNAGKSFQSVRSIAYSGTGFKGIADVVLEKDATSNTDVAVLYGRNNRLLFPAGFGSPLNSNNITYTYRTADESLSISNTGVLTVSLSSSPGRTFPYTSELSDFQKSEIFLAPKANLVSQSGLTGTVNVTSTSANVGGVGTTFVSELKAGQYVYFSDGTNSSTRRVVAVNSSTSLTLDANVGFTNTGITAKKAWPAWVPIQLSYDSSITANVTGSDDVLNINLGETLATASNTDVLIAYNVEVTDVTPTTKTPSRGNLVKLRLANNEAGTDGPWCLGVPDIFRLRAVYSGNSSVTTASSDVTDEFFIDHNQNSNYYNLGYLYRKPKSDLILTDDTYLLVEFDCFTSSPGFYTVGSYVSGSKATRYEEDSKSLSELSDTVNTFEIPEVFDDSGRYYDLISMVDFRPIVDATANVTSNASLVTTNPTSNVSFSSSDRYFPVPDSIFRHDVEYFQSRIDAVVLDGGGSIKVVQGVSGSGSPPTSTVGAMRLNNVSIPAYPSLPERLSDDVLEILSTGVHSNKFVSNRVNVRKIRTLFRDEDYDLSQPKTYTNLEIGQIDRRLRNVEYYIGFNFLQNSIKDKVIPSSISPNIDRFKYGFFVDDYRDESSSDVDSPEYSASTANGFATPLQISFNMVHKGDGFTSSPYTSVKLLSQDSATELPPPEVVIIKPKPPVILKYEGGMKIEPPAFKAQSYTVTTSTSSTTVGSSTKSGGGGKIVCTAMNEEYGFGSFRNAIWLHHSAGMRPEYEVGYHSIFLPYVEYAWRSEHRDGLLARAMRTVGERIARKRTVDIWKQRRGKRDIEGMVYRTILEPICFAVGWLKTAINRSKGD